MIAAGIDLGGTKIEAQLFDANWDVADKRRLDTPKTYDALVATTAELVTWTKSNAADIPVGIGAAGLIHPETGLALTSNICASGRPFPLDIAKAAGCDVTYINDCRALALSEAVFGAGRNRHTVMSLILGTGIGGGLAIGGKLPTGPTKTGGEFGHISASAAILSRYNLPLWDCGCGRAACVEAYCAGPGLERLALTMIGEDLTTRQIADARHARTSQVWTVWCALMGDVLRNLILTIDPDVITLGGGLSNMEGVAEALSEATQAAQFAGFSIPPIVLAQGGDTSGGRGAAYGAWLEQT